MLDVNVHRSMLTRGTENPHPEAILDDDGRHGQNNPKLGLLQ
jgi:hypothetical protein